MGSLALRKRIWTTAVYLFAFVLLILISRGMDQLLPPEALQVTHPVTVVALCVIIVLTVRDWLPRGRR